MRVLMIGPSRNVKGGISTLVNNYYQAGLDKKIELAYLKTMEDGSKIRKLFVAVKSFSRFLLMSGQYDLLHVHMASGASFHRKSFFIRHAKRLNKRIIIHLHGAEFKKYYHERNNEKQQKNIRTIFGYADCVIALSNSWKEFLSTITDPHKIEVIYNCVPVPTEFEKNHTEKGMLFLGRIGDRKGIFDLMEIMPDIIKAYPQAHLSVGGDGEIKRLHDCIEEHDLQNYVTHIGWVTDEAKEKHLMESSIYLLPSYNEGLPMGMLEAMSYKCAVVTSNVGGIPEVINHGQNGLMVEPGDQKGLQSLILDLMLDENKCIHMGENAYRSILEDYSCEIAIKRVLAVYHKLKGVG